MKRIVFSCIGAGVVALACATVQADSTAFGGVQTFESELVGAQPAAWRDADNGWFGQAAVVASGTDGVVASPTGGSKFVKVTPDAPNTYFGGAARDAAYTTTGSSTPFPAAGNTYSVFRDIYAQSTGAGNFWMQNTIRDTGGNYLTEASFRFATGAAQWNLTFAGGSAGGVNLATGSWYTLEEVWDRSAANVQVTYNVYAAGGPLLHSEALGTYNNVLSANLGGSGAHSWFSVWDNGGVPAAVYADNFGTGPLAVVPLPAAAWMGLSLLGSTGVVGFFRKRRTVAATL